MSEILIDKLKKYNEQNYAPFHMPGHKRTTGLYDYIENLSSAWDITEVEGFDNLHGASGILREAMDKAAGLYQSQRSFFLVNGSSGGILAGIRTATTRGDHIIAARNCHKSVYNAIELCGLVPHFVLPMKDDKFNIYGSVSPESVEILIRQYPETKLIVVTSPTYDGVISDIGEICRIAHEKGIPVMVDEAHGAHLGFLFEDVKSAVSLGADIVIQSTHKTLPSLTQTALAHINGELIDPADYEWQLSVFETTSPSYLLMASLDGCTHYLKEHGHRAFSEWRENLRIFEEKISCLDKLKILKYGKDSGESHPSIYRFDKSKILISAAGTTLDGITLAKYLRDQFGIEPEMELGSSVTAMTGMGTTLEHLDRLASALLSIDSRCGKDENNCHGFILNELPERTAGAEEIRHLPWENVDIRSAEGRIMAKYLWAYPPGSPFLIPGEIISRQIIDAICRVSETGTTLKYSGGDFKGIISVVKR